MLWEHGVASSNLAVPIAVAFSSQTSPGRCGTQTLRAPRYSSYHAPLHADAKQRSLGTVGPGPLQIADPPKAATFVGMPELWRHGLAGGSLDRAYLQSVDVHRLAGACDFDPSCPALLGRERRDLEDPLGR